MPKFSFIVPIYNAERFLRQCLDSIKNQTEDDFEAILVDDGSTDSSGVIADEYSATDKRFRVIHQLNQGTSGATNTGLNLAQGDYIVNLDNDDYVDAGLLKDAAAIIECCHPDIIQYQASFVDINGVVVQEQDFFHEEWVAASHGEIALCELKMPGAFNRTHSRKIIKRERIGGLRFEGTSKGADTSFIRRLVFRCEKVFMSPKRLYFVREVLTSESRKPNPPYLYKEWFDREIRDLDYCINQNGILNRTKPFFEFADLKDMLAMYSAKAINDGAYDKKWFKNMGKAIWSRRSFIVDGSRAMAKLYLWTAHNRFFAKRLAKKIKKGDFIV